jgi:Tfp pilus assembly protein PilN
VGAGALLLLAVVSESWAARASASEARAAFDRIRSEAAATVDQARALEARKAEGGRTLASQAALTREAPPPRVLSELTALLPRDVRLESVTLAYGERLEIEVSVVARTASSYDLFLARLAESKRFRDVLPGAESRDAEVRGSVRLSFGAAS